MLLCVMASCIIGTGYKRVQEVMRRTFYLTHKKNAMNKWNRTQIMWFNRALYNHLTSDQFYLIMCLVKCIENIPRAWVLHVSFFLVVTKGKKVY